MKLHPIVRSSASTLVVLTLSLAGWIAAPASVTAADQELRTQATLITGFPDAEAGQPRGVLVVPGTVIPVEQGSSYAVRTDEDRNALLGKLANQLSSTFRLSRIDIAYTQPLNLTLERPERLPAPTLTSGIQITVEILGFDDETATYQVVFEDGGKSLADSRVFVRRGEKAVVGGVDGPEAPYFFLVLEPASRSAGHGSGPYRVGGDIQHPRAITRVPPAYTEEAKEKRIQGVAILQAIIDTEGRIEDVKVLKGLPHGLTEAAVEAVRQWRFEPARDGDGQPVPVYYNLTINFRLDNDHEEK